MVFLDVPVLDEDLDLAGDCLLFFLIFSPSLSPCCLGFFLVSFSFDCDDVLSLPSGSK